ncbi:MAG TPA: hemerythrin domain-containing protein [Chloroflexota bacterium]|nr:hemerythrin domain-containing protein [Chloroflexota bacterium]
MAIRQPSTLPSKSTERLGDPGQLDAITLLLRDHRAVQQALNDYLRCRDIDEKAEILRDVIADLEEHERMEEAAFWPMIRRALPDGAKLADECMAEEAEAKGLIGEIRAMDRHDPAWLPKVQRLIAAVLDHAGREQLEVFQPLRSALPVDELMAWGKELDRVRRSL